MTSAKAIPLCAALLLGGVLPAHAAPQESFLEAPAGAGLLKGTLLTPSSAPTATVLIVPGSGPTDRDGNNPLGVKASTYRLLAEGLAARGVATLRIDKRGMYASATAAANANAVTLPDYVDDMNAWVGVLRKQTGAPCVWVLGHSEGGLVALAAAQRVPGLCGLILVSTPGRPLGEVLRSQLKANPANAPLLDQALPAIDKLERGERVDTTNMNPALMPLFRPAVQGFLINAFSYDPARLVADVAKPVLVLQGQSDVQVGEADARLLKQANPRAELVLLPGVNHVLKQVTGDDRRANIATYSDPSLPLAPGVVDAIARFLAHGASSDSGRHE
jgi:pimeloyl-ACP methyl ester carboxylesterase